MSSPCRCITALLAIVFISLFVACGSVSAPVAVAVSPSGTKAIDQAQTIDITATVANDSKNGGVTWSVAGGGTLSNQTTTSATYNAPASVLTSFTANVTATSVSDPSKSASLRIAVNPLPAITTQSVPQATAGVNYSAAITASGGSSPFTWSVASGTLPNGITLGSSTTSSTTISGMPTVSGSSSVTFKVVDGTGVSATQAMTITVNPPATLVITTGSLSAGIVGVAYSQTLAATGGVPSYHWAIMSGSLPSGLTLNANSGAITGIPTTSGTSSFGVRVTDSQTPAASATANLSITISNPLPLQITTTSLPDGTTSSGYTATLAATGGLQPYSWSITAGNLPPGLNLSSNTGQISGTPTTSGTFSFTVAVTDSENPAMETAAGFSITIDAGTPLQIETTSLPEGSEATAYSVTLSASGGVQPYTWSVSSGNLPGGLTLNASAGTITGKPTALGTFNLTLKVTDSASGTATAPLNILIITCNNDGALSGNWAMLLQGFNNIQVPAPQIAAVGSFVADGAGNITSGTLDSNDQVNGPASGTMTGQYCISTNNAGLMTLHQTVGGSSTTHTYAVVLNTTNSNGRIVSYDNSTTIASGPLRQQTVSAFATNRINGYYGFGLIGADAGGPAAVSRFGIAGEFTANGAGTLSGMADGNADGTLTPQMTLQASDLTVLSNTTGRGTVTITFVGQGNLDFVFYVVNATELLMMGTDAATDSLLAGRVLGQTGAGTFNNLSLNGNAILGIQGIDGSGITPAGTVSAGIIDSAGNGTATISLDQNDAGVAGTVSATGSYGVSSNGRVTLSGFGNHAPILYLVSQNSGFAIGTDDSVMFGQFSGQTGSNFTNASIAGTYTGGSEAPEDAGSGSEVDSIASNGVGTFTGLSLANADSPQNNSISETYGVSSNGRVVVSKGTSQVGIMYIVNANSLLFMPVGGTGGNVDPTLRGFDQ